MFHNSKKYGNCLKEKTQQHRIYVSHGSDTGACYCVQGKPVRVLFQKTFARIGPWVMKKSYGAFFGRNPRGYISWIGRKIFPNMQVFCFFNVTWSFREILFLCFERWWKTRLAPQKKRLFQILLCLKACWMSCTFWNKFWCFGGDPFLWGGFWGLFLEVSC